MISLDGPSLHLGRISGIPIRIHWTFSLFILFISYIAYEDQIPTEQLFGFYSVVLLLFVFVIMHEFGHALAGRKYGISTRDIIISPIGGIARLESIPVDPIHELVIALAGPAVNVVLAVFFFLFQFTFSGSIFPSGLEIDLGSRESYIGLLLTINIVLVVFNLIPAFPMDGGRVLRALLDLRLKDRYKATKWAVRVGQILAICFILFGLLWGNYMLIFIGFFVFISARSESKQMKIVKAMKATPIMELLQSELRSLNTQDVIEEVLKRYGKKNFLVADDLGETIGYLSSLAIEKAERQKRLNLTVGDLFISLKGSTPSSNSIMETLNAMNHNDWVIIEVIDEKGNKKGVVHRQLLINFINSI